MKLYNECHPIKLQLVDATLSEVLADTGGAIISPPLANNIILTLKIRYLLRVESIENTYLSFQNSGLNNIDVDFKPSGKEYMAIIDLSIFIGDVGKVETFDRIKELEKGIVYLNVEAGRKIKKPVQLKIVIGDNNNAKTRLSQDDI